MKLIQLSGVEKAYGENTVLSNVNLTINKGELIAITGQSGAGKSTLLNILSGIEKATSGTVSIFGTKNPIPNSSAMQKIIRENINYMFQNFALIENETVFFNLSLALQYKNLNKQQKQKIISHALADMGIEQMANRKVFTLSGGEQQRVAMARILINPKNILFADEPTGSLDESNKEKVLSFLHSMCQKGMAVVVVTHDKVVANACNKHYTIMDGHVEIV